VLNQHSLLAVLLVPLLSWVALGVFGGFLRVDGRGTRGSCENVSSVRPGVFDRSEGCLSFRYYLIQARSHLEFFVLASLAMSRLTVDWV
jgi:hypothetical protein